MSTTITASALSSAVRYIDNSSVDIPDEIAAFFAGEVAKLTSKTNTTKVTMDVATLGMDEQDAILLRAQAKEYGRTHNLAVSLPSEDRFGKSLNSGTRVTFRLALRRAGDDEHDANAVVVPFPDANGDSEE